MLPREAYLLTRDAGGVKVKNQLGKSDMLKPWKRPKYLELIAEYKTFTLWENFPPLIANEWRDFKVADSHKRKRSDLKRNWHVAWNGERFARTTECGSLAARHPEILAWAENILRENSGAKQPAYQVDTGDNTIRSATA